MDREFTVLSVEDNPDDRLILEQAFRRSGLAVTLRSVADGEAAANYLLGLGPYVDRTQYPLPSVILLDLKLPKKSGFDVLGWLRARSDLRRVPVLVLTSSREPSDVRRAYELGATSYHVKPTAFNEMVALVQGVTSYWFALNVFPPE